MTRARVRVAATLACAAALLGAALGWLTGPAPDPGRGAVGAPVEDGGVAGGSPPVHGPAGASDRASPSDPEIVRLARGPRPASLVGTDVDGGLSVDAAGHFRPDRDALALFHYFLAASGEEPLAVIRQRIVDEIHRRLAPPADGEAVAFLDDYLDLRDAVRALAEGGEIPHDLERRLQWLRELRREHLGPLAEDVFAEEEAAVLVDLERRRVALDPELDEAERAERLAALEAQLPERVREARRRARAPARVHADVRALREAGADEDAIFAVREATFGAEAAERLAALDAERAAWERRLAAYRDARVALLDELGLAADAEERTLADAERARLEALRRSHFEEHEVLRVRALDAAL